MILECTHITKLLTLRCLKKYPCFSFGKFQAGYIGVKVPNERPVSLLKHQAALTTVRNSDFRRKVCTIVRRQVVPLAYYPDFAIIIMLDRPKITVPREEVFPDIGIPFDEKPGNFCSPTRRGIVECGGVSGKLRLVDILTHVETHLNLLQVAGHGSVVQVFRHILCQLYWSHSFRSD